jgi:UDP-glucose 4-epimerase
VNGAGAFACSTTATGAIRTQDGVEVLEGDIRYAHMVESAVQGAEAVVHLAAVCMNKSIADPTESLDVNLMGTQNVLDAASRATVRRIIYASSASVYGNPTSLPMREDDKLAPITPYCVAKLAGEQMLDFYARRANLTWLALRFFNVYGPGQPTDAYYTSVVVTFLNRLAAGEAPVIDGKGDQSMDFVHVRDVARSVGMALDSRVSGQALNVGTGEQTTIADLAELLVRQLGSDVQPIYRPREVLVTQRRAAIDRILEVLGWTPQIDVETGIASVVDWHKRLLADTRP